MARVSRPVAPRSPEDIFNDALDMPLEDRDAFLVDACSGDHDLLARMRALLPLADRPPIRLDLAHTLCAGDRLGPYGILEELGRGGMGVVYRAEDPRLQRQIAVKVLPDWVAGDEKALDRFQREARMLASLNHPNIATIHSLEEAGGIHFITMEHVQGKTLAETLEDGPVALEPALEICLQIAEAIEAAHSEGVVHRDLKPANVMMTPRGTVKVLDFGVAKALRASDTEGVASPSDCGEGTTSRGTPGYMSPEQMMCGAVDHRTDIWSMGCIIHECVTGRPLVPPGDVWRGSGGDGAFPAIRPVFPKGLSRKLRSLILGCVEVNVERRIGAIRKVRASLQREIRVRKAGRTVRLGAAVAAMIAGLAAVITLMLGGPSELSSVAFDDSRTIVEALDDRGRAIWDWRMPHPVSVNPSWVRSLDAEQNHTPLIVSDQGRAQAVILATRPDASPGVLWSLDASSGEPLWKREVQWELPRTAGEIARGVYSWEVLIDWEGKPALAVGIRNGRWYASAVQFLSVENEILGTYYHPGHIYLRRQADLDGDGSASLILFGSNSSARLTREAVPFETRRHCGCIILLEPPCVDGQAFPYSEVPEPRDWPGMRRAREESYLLIPPLAPDLPATVTQVSFSPPEQRAVTLEARVDDGRIYFLGPDLYPRRCWFSSESESERLRDAGDARVLPLILIRDGDVRRVDVPSG